MTARFYIGLFLLVIGIFFTIWTSPIFVVRPQMPQLYVWLYCDTEVNPFSHSYAPNLRVTLSESGQWKTQFTFHPFESSSVGSGLCSYKYLRATEPFSIAIEATRDAEAVNTSAQQNSGVFEVDFEEGLKVLTDRPVTIMFDKDLVRPLDPGRVILQATVGLGVDGSDNDPISGTPDYAPVYLTVPVDTPILETSGQVTSTDFLLQAFNGKTPAISYEFKGPTPIRMVLEAANGRLWNDLLLLFAGLIMGTGFSLVVEALVGKFARQDLLTFRIR